MASRTPNTRSRLLAILFSLFVIRTASATTGTAPNPGKQFALGAES
jgi:hypothetical protein